MARALHQRRGRPLIMPLDPSIPGVEVKPVPFWAPAKGVDYRSRITNVPREFTSDALNMLVRDGVWYSRYGVVRVGTTISGVTAVAKFITSHGVAHLIAFRPGTTQARWDGAAWQAIPGSYTLAASATQFTHTEFGDNLIFSNGVDGMYVFDPSRGDIQRIDGAPSAKHLTTFAGRIIASSVRDPNVNASRIRWCVNRNFRDWTGLGSGYEDLLSTPGGDIDRQGGVFPLDDTNALVIRTESLWAMTATGLSDAPFRFTRMVGMKGSDAPYSAAVTPYGVMFLGIDDITLVGLGTFEEIGRNVKDRILDNVTDIERVVGTYVPDAYNPRTGEYCLLVPENDATYIYRAPVPGKEWSRHQLAVNPTWLTYVRGGNLPLTIDGLGAIEPTIDELGNTFPTIDSMVGAADHGPGLVFCSTNVVSREDASTSQDDFTGTPADASILLVTGAIVAGDPFHYTNILEVALLYEASETQTLVFEYSANAGTSWSAYGSHVVVATNRPRTLAMRKTVEGYNFIIRMRSTTIGKLKVHSLVPSIQVGKPVQDFDSGIS